MGDGVPNNADKKKNLLTISQLAGLIITCS